MRVSICLAIRVCGLHLKMSCDSGTVPFLVFAPSFFLWHGKPHQISFGLTDGLETSQPSLRIHELIGSTTATHTKSK